MNILLAPDKFKGSLSANQVIDALKKGILRANKNAKFHAFTLSDGGDGFLSSIANNLNVEDIQTKTVDPLGDTIVAPYLWHATTRTAYVELAKTGGMALLSPEKCHVMETTTIGLGRQLMDAINRGAKLIYVGLGGSATNDAGIGLASVFGYQFLDGHNQPLKPIGRNLIQVKKIVPPKTNKAKDVQIVAVNDVDNPLYGKNGAAYVYAKQKGASETDIALLDQGLVQLATLAKNQLKKDVSKLPGAGAAGGTAFGLKTFLNAEFVNGTHFLMEHSGINTITSEQNIDLIITGEGKIDAQTLNGKLIKGIANLGLQNNIPVLAICGTSELNPELASNINIDEILVLNDGDKDMAYCMLHASDLVESKIFEYFNRTLHEKK